VTATSMPLGARFLTHTFVDPARTVTVGMTTTSKMKVEEACSNEGSMVVVERNDTFLEIFYDSS
jgi:hypothetical protein